jgi:hypothetical protein
MISIVNALNFAIKCVKNPKSKKMFPEAKKIHQMEIIKSEKYQEQHANTCKTC